MKIIQIKNVVCASVELIWKFLYVALKNAAIFSNAQDSWLLLWIGMATTFVTLLIIRIHLVDFPGQSLFLLVDLNIFWKLSSQMKNVSLSDRQGPSLGHLVSLKTLRYGDRRNTVTENIWVLHLSRSASASYSIYFISPSSLLFYNCQFTGWPGKRTIA